MAAVSRSPQGAIRPEADLPWRRCASPKADGRMCETAPTRVRSACSGWSQPASRVPCCLMLVRAPLGASRRSAFPPNVELQHSQVALIQLEEDVILWLRQREQVTLAEHFSQFDFYQVADVGDRDIACTAFEGVFGALTNLVQRDIDP